VVGTLPQLASQVALSAYFPSDIETHFVTEQSHLCVGSTQALSHAEREEYEPEVSSLHWYEEEHEYYLGVELQSAWHAERWDCSVTKCVSMSDGKYADKATCEANCGNVPTTYSCEAETGTCNEATGGKYSDLTAC
jgi:hypothetical protein